MIDSPDEECPQLAQSNAGTLINNNHESVLHNFAGSETSKAPVFFETQYNLVKDKYERDHVAYSRTGPGYIMLASSQCSPSTTQAHCEDIHIILKENPQFKKPVLQLITDGGKKTMFCSAKEQNSTYCVSILGDDYSLRNVTCVHSFGRMWVREELEVLICVKFAPKASRFNPIERTCSKVGSER